MPRPVLGAKIPPPRSTHDLAQQKRQNRWTTLPHTPDCTPAPHLHSQQAVCGRECERNSQQYCRARDAFPPRHPQRSVHRDHGHLSHTGPLPAVQGSGPRLGLAWLVVILGALMVTPIYFLNTINDAAALLLARGADFLSAFDKPQRDALVMVFFRMHSQGILANEVFWGLWLFPFGLLVYRSRFLPRILGVWLMLNCFAYLAVSFTGLLFPQYEARVFNSAFPAMLGEVAIMLWLLIKGAKPQPLGAAASSLAAC